MASLSTSLGVSVLAHLVVVLAAGQGQLPISHSGQLPTSPAAGMMKGTQRYAFGRGRSLTTTDGFGRIRLSVRMLSLALNTAEQQFLTGTLLPASIGKLSAALQVRPITGNFFVSRACTSQYSNGRCASETTARCGIAADGSSAPIDESLLDSLEVCGTCYTDGTCTGCSTSPAGSGMPATDFLLLVSSVSTAACAGSTIAYASPCQRECVLPRSIPRVSRHPHSPSCRRVSPTQSVGSPDAWLR